MCALEYWLWLLTRVSTPVAWKLLRVFEDPKQIYCATAADYAQYGVESKVQEKLLNKEMRKAEQILERCERLGIQILTIEEQQYPCRLTQIAVPPLVLYLFGQLPDVDNGISVGVVGTRRPTPYGIKYAHQFGVELAQSGAILVSGIAQGLDACAIQGALDGGGPVISVLGNGVDVIYPREHQELYHRVATSGALVSEYPPGTEPNGDHFPIRNRIISGLSAGVLALECRRSSGTMSTICHAIEQDRDIFAIPGALDAPMSQGTNWLIQQGAKLVTCGEDILQEYPYYLHRNPSNQVEYQGFSHQSLSWKGNTGPSPTPKERRTISKSEQESDFTPDGLAILTALGKESLTIDELVERTQISTNSALSALTILQIEGVVEEQVGKRFAALVELET